MLPIFILPLTLGKHISSHQWINSKDLCYPDFPSSATMGFTYFLLGGATRIDENLWVRLYQTELAFQRVWTARCRNSGFSGTLVWFHRCFFSSPLCIAKSHSEFTGITWRGRCRKLVANCWATPLAPRLVFLYTTDKVHDWLKYYLQSPVVTDKQFLLFFQFTASRQQESCVRNKIRQWSSHAVLDQTRNRTEDVSVLINKSS